MALDINDKTSNGNNLTNSGATEWTTNFPFTSSTEAINLVAASSQYLYITDAGQTGLDLSGDFTIEGWVSLDIGDSCLASKSNGTGDQRGYFIRLNGTEVQLGISNNGTSVAGNYLEASVSYTFTLGTWTHVAVTFDASAGQMELFINAISQGTVNGFPTSIFNNTAEFQIGNRSGALFFDGRIDEVRVWNDIRTSTEISSNKSSELTGTESGLVAYWPFELLTPKGGAALFAL